MENPNESSVFCRLCVSGELWGICEEYISSCIPPDTDAKAKKNSRFPNLAGLCRYVGTGLDELRHLKLTFPEAYDRLLAIFEDEALNFDASSSVLSSYMKKRLLFSAEDDAKQLQDAKAVSYCFEHDIYADGG